MSCNCGCNELTPTLAPVDKCKAQLASTSIAELIWIQGLDVKLCERFQRLADVLQLRDCANNRIAIDTPLVCCTDFKDQLCLALATLVSNGEATTDTLLVGADCKLYTLPPATGNIETPNSSTQSNTVTITLSGILDRNIQAAVIISTDIGNQLEAHSDGLFVPAVDPVISTCTQIQAFSNGGDAVEGTVIIAADCTQRTLRWPESLSVTNSGAISLSLIANTLSAALILDPDFIGRITGNGLELTCADVLTCAPPVTVLDTASVNLTISGQQVSADVLISPDANNSLSQHANGLFVSVCNTLNAGAGPVPALRGSTVLVGADCNKYTLPTDANIAVQDTSSVDLTLAGNTISALVKVSPSTLITSEVAGLSVTCDNVKNCIWNTTNNFWTWDTVQVTFDPSADSGNAIVTGTDGKPFVETFVLTPGTTNCATVTFAAGVLSVFPTVSGSVGNQLSCTPSGLFVGETTVSVTGQSTVCVQITVGSPFQNQFVIQSSLILDPTAGNILQCTPTGLRAEVAVNLAGDSTNCIDVTIVESPSNTFTITAEPIVDPDSCNGLECRTNGLWAPNSGQSISNSSLAGADVINGAVNTPDIIPGPIHFLLIENPSTCCDAVLTLHFNMPMITTDSVSSPDFVLQTDLICNINLPGILVTGGPVIINSMRTLTGDADGITSLSYSWAIPASFSGSVTSQVMYTVSSGSSPSVQAQDTSIYFAIQSTC